MNKNKNKRFIDSARNIETYKTYLVQRLDKGNHKNKRLQKEWDSYSKRDREKVFIFEVLETIDDDFTSTLSERKEYWVNHFRSNEIDHGYNLELYKRPWEKKRDEWRNIRSWGVEGDIQEILREVISKLDYELEYSEDRIDHLNKLLTDDIRNWLYGYISSPLFSEKQIKNKTDFLTENDLSLFGFNVIVDYIVFPKYKNKEEKKLNVEEEYKIRKKKSDINMDHRRGNEKLFGNKDEIESEVSSLTLFNPNVKESEEQKLHTVATRHTITDKDLKEYEDIEEVYRSLEYLKRALGQGQDAESREQIQQDLIAKYGSKQVAYMKKLQRDLSTEILIMKEILSGTIRFKRITDGTTVPDYDSDTGYFTQDDEYVLVSENKIELSKEKHVLELINHYSQLRQRFYDKPDSDMWAILYDLDQLIEQTEFEDYVKDILVMKIDGYLAYEIIEDIEEKHGVKLTEDRLSRIHNQLIPKKIVETYLQSKEDWIYTYKVKGTYKTCSKCKAVKLLNERYFGKKADSKDGFHTICKSCR